MNVPIRKSLALLMLAALLAGRAPALAQSEATLSGTITDPNGNALKDAKVILLGRNVTVTTNAEGKYTFTGASAGVGGKAMERAAMAAGGALKAEGGGLRFAIRGGTQRVRISLFTLEGRLASEVADARLDDGEYQVTPFKPGMAPGNYLARVRIGPQRHILTLSYVGGAASESGFRKSAPAGSEPAGSDRSPALRKTGAVVDTLSVIAVGFERGERLVEALSGTQDFKLNALKYVNIQYKTGNLNAAEKSACVLDIRIPKTGSKWPVVLHFHGGGMTGGDRNEAFTASYNYFGQKFLDAGIIEVSPGYRLIGQGTWPDYIRDAVQASIWIRKNIEAYGGDPHSVFLSGFSAGAYLTHMMAIDTTWFGEAKFDPRKFAGFVSLSGQTRQHDNIRADLKVSDIMKEKPYAMPMGHIRKTAIPWQIFVGGLEGGTVTDNQTMYNELIKAGSTDLYFDIIPNQPHTVGDMAAADSPKRDKFFAFINKYKGKGL
jgi:hypothetical protein